MNLINRFLGPVIFALSVLALLVMYLNYSSDIAKQGPATDIGLQASYVLFILAIIGIIFGFVITALTNPASILRTGIGVVVILIIWGLSYAIAGNEVNEVYETFKVDAGLSKMIGSFLTLTGILGLITILGIVATEVLSAIR
ncbi:MAG: hypothetical protein HC913_24025 [Microscillaceae bacterium]|nr:hypothetical protein [Microscillaceae bacterium]